MSEKSEDMVVWRIKAVEDKVNSIENKLNDIVVNTAIMKTELASASSKTSSIISVVLSIGIGYVGYILKGG